MGRVREGARARGKGHKARGKTFLLVAPSLSLRLSPSQKCPGTMQITGYFTGFHPISWKVFFSTAEVFGVSKND